MIDNFWIFVTQLCSVLVYIGTVFGLYRLLASQKDATIQAKDATIENLQVQLQQIESRVPDTLVTLLKDRLTASREELERLKHDKDKSSVEVESLKERQKIASETIGNLLAVVDIIQSLSKPVNEHYKDFVVAICGSVGEAATTILTSENLTDLASKHGKTIKEVSHEDVLPAMLRGEEEGTMVNGLITSQGSYAILEDNIIRIDNAMLSSLSQKHKVVLED